MNLRSEGREINESFEYTRRQKAMKNVQKKNRKAVFGGAKGFAELENSGKEFHHCENAFLSLSELLFAYTLTLYRHPNRTKALYPRADSTATELGTSNACERFPALRNRNSILLPTAKSAAATANSPKSNNRAEDT